MLELEEGLTSVRALVLEVYESATAGPVMEWRSGGQSSVTARGLALRSELAERGMVARATVPRVRHRRRPSQLR